MDDFANIHQEARLVEGRRGGLALPTWFLIARPAPCRYGFTDEELDFIVNYGIK